MSKAYGIEEARPILGDLVTAAQYGQTTTITRNGKPAARIVPIEEPNVTVTIPYKQYMAAVKSSTCETCRDGCNCNGDPGTGCEHLGCWGPDSTDDCPEAVRLRAFREGETHATT